MEQWASGQFQGDSQEAVAILNAGALGQINCYRQLIELELDQFNEVLLDDEK